MSPMEYDKSRIQFKLNSSQKKNEKIKFLVGSGARPSAPVREAIEQFDTESILDNNESKSRPSEEPVEKRRSQPSRAECLQNAKVLMANQEFRLAENILLRMLSVNANDELATLWLGRCYKGLQMWAESIECLHTVWRSRPSLDLAIEYADLLYDAEENEKAVSMYQHALGEIQQEGVELLHVLKNLGNAYVRLSDFEAAEECYNKAYTLDPDSDVLLINFGTLELQRQNYGLAIDRFRRAVEINRDNDKAWIGLALVHRAFGDFELSTANMERALDINPYNSTALRLYSDWSLKKGRPQMALEKIEHYLNEYDRDISVLLLASKMNFVIGKMDIAKQMAERARELGELDESSRLIHVITNQNR